MSMMEPAVAELSTAVALWPDRARALVVADQDGFTSAGGMLRDVKTLLGEIEAQVGPVVSQAHAAHREAVALRKRLEAPLLTAETILKGAMGKYANEQARLRFEESLELEREVREAEARRQAEEHKAEEETRLAEAEALDAAGRGAEALAVLAAPMPEPDPILPPVVPTVPVPSAEGISLREVWKAEVNDLRALVEAIAAGKAPLSLVMAATSELGAWARSTRRSMPLPGVRVWSEKSVAARSSR